MANTFAEIIRALESRALDGDELSIQTLGMISAMMDGWTPDTDDEQIEAPILMH